MLYKLVGFIKGFDVKNKNIILIKLLLVSGFVSSNLFGSQQDVNRVTFAQFEQYFLAEVKPVLESVCLQHCVEIRHDDDAYWKRYAQDIWNGDFRRQSIIAAMLRGQNNSASSNPKDNN